MQHATVNGSWQLKGISARSQLSASVQRGGASAIGGTPSKIRGREKRFEKVKVEG